MFARTIRFAATFPLALVAWGLLGCRTPATQTDLTITSTCPQRTDRDLTLVVTAADGMTRTYRFDDVSWPFAQTFAPASPEGLRYSVDVTLRDGALDLDTQTVSGDHVVGTRSTREIMLVDPACAVLDAGPRLDAPIDPSVDAWSLDTGPVPLDAGLDAFAPDAAPFPGCERRAYDRETEQLELLYSFARTTGTRVPNEAPGGEPNTDLEGVFIWESDGTCAHVSGTPRPNVPDAMAIADALDRCQDDATITIEAWIDVEVEPRGGAREEVFTHGEQGSGARSAFVLGIASNEVIAATNGCDGQARPMYRFARPSGLVHLVYTQRPIPLDAAMGPFDAGGAPTETWGFENAYVNGESAPLSESTVSGEMNAGCVPPGNPGLRRYGVGVSPTSSVHLGGAPWGGFQGCYHLLAVYCRALTLTEARNNYCAGPPTP